VAIKDSHFSTLEVANEVLAHVDVLDAGYFGSIFNQSDGRLIVTMDGHRAGRKVQEPRQSLPSQMYLPA
jgi:hypothetical protein